MQTPMATYKGKIKTKSRKLMSTITVLSIFLIFSSYIEDYMVKPKLELLFDPIFWHGHILTIKLQSLCLNLLLW